MAINLEELWYGKKKMVEGKRKKRTKITPKQRVYIWEHPKIYGRTCNICHQKITKLSDLELDHTKAFSKGGKKLALAHRDCNRMKASGSLRKIQKELGIKTKKRTKRKGGTKKRKKKATRSKGMYWVNPFTGKKEPLLKY